MSRKHENIEESPYFTNYYLFSPRPGRKVYVTAWIVLKQKAPVTAVTGVSPNPKILPKIPDKLQPSGVYCAVLVFTWPCSHTKVHVLLAILVPCLVAFVSQALLLNKVSPGIQYIFKLFQTITHCVLRCTQCSSFVTGFFFQEFNRNSKKLGRKTPSWRAEWFKRCCCWAQSSRQRSISVIEQLSPL